METVLRVTAIVLSWGYIALAAYVLYLQICGTKLKRTVRKAIKIQSLAVALQLTVVMLNLITDSESVILSIVTLGAGFVLIPVLHQTLKVFPEHTEDELKAKREWEAVERAHNEIIDELSAIYNADYDGKRS